MYDETNLLPLSALQHLVFCERQCALIHIDQVWEENLQTAQGRSLHERTHEADSETRGDLRIARALRLRSLTLGLIGVADVVEFHLQDKDSETPEEETDTLRENTYISLLNTRGHWRPFPVEYKRGKPKMNNCDRVQICAQALCLEEMLSASIPSGALFYGKTRRRQDVTFDDALRQETRDAAQKLHALIDSGQVPSARYAKKCDSCSLAGHCLPKSAARGQGARAYLNRAIRQLEKDNP